MSTLACSVGGITCGVVVTAAAAAVVAAAAAVVVATAAAVVAAAAAAAVAAAATAVVGDVISVVDVISQDRPVFRQVCCNIKQPYSRLHWVNLYVTIFIAELIIITGPAWKNKCIYRHIVHMFN